MYAHEQLHDLALAMSQRTPDPHLSQTNACQQHLEASGDIVKCVVKILQQMEELHINLLIFLWAIYQLECRRAYI